MKHNGANAMGKRGGSGAPDFGGIPVAEMGQNCKRMFYMEANGSNPCSLDLKLPNPIQDQRYGENYQKVYRRHMHFCEVMQYPENN